MSTKHLKKAESGYLNMDHGFISFIVKNQHRRLEELSQAAVQNTKAQKLIAKKKKKPDLARYVPPGRRSISAANSEEDLAETKPERGIDVTTKKTLSDENLVEVNLQSSAGTTISEKNLAESKVQSPVDMDKLFASGLSSTESAVKTSKSLCLVFLEQTEDSKHLRSEFLRKLQKEYQTALGNCDKEPECALRLFTFISTVYRFVRVCGEPLKVLEKPVYNLASTLLKASSATASIQEVCSEVAELDITADSCEIHILLNTMKDLIISEDSTEETRSHLVAVLDARARKWCQKYRHH